MQFVKTACWVVLVGLIVLFSATNWTRVTINLWSDLQVETPLPLVVIVAFLAGSLPFWILHKMTRWRMRRRLDSAERALASVKPGYPPPPPPPPPSASDASIQPSRLGEP